jgi:hypothetical protein
VGIGPGAGVIRPGMTMPAVVLVARGGGRGGRNDGERCAADDGQRGEQTTQGAATPIGGIEGNRHNPVLDRVAQN